MRTLILVCGANIKCTSLNNNHISCDALNKNCKKIKERKKNLKELVYNIDLKSEQISIYSNEDLNLNMIILNI